MRTVVARLDRYPYKVQVISGVCNFISENRCSDGLYGAMHVARYARLIRNTSQVPFGSVVARQVNASLGFCVEF
jgi:hypothetical protein